MGFVFPTKSGPFFRALQQSFNPCLMRTLVCFQNQSWIASSFFNFDVPTSRKE